MIIKDKDDSQSSIDYLSDLLERDIPDDKKRLIERELKCLYSGNKGEESSAYYLNFDFGHRKNWVVIHDLRLEHDGDVAQIDHLLIGRMMDIYVIESKNLGGGSAISQINNYDINPLTISYPSSREDQGNIVNRFFDLLFRSQRLENIYQHKLTALAELKQSLLQTAFAGELH